MKQSPTKSYRTHSSLEILTTPTCEKCGGQTRFVGLEADTIDDNAELSTYECNVCEHVQVAIVVKTNGHDRPAA